MWLAYDQKGELIGELVLESGATKHDGMVKKRHTLFLFPVACDLEDSSYSRNTFSPSVSYFMCSSERDYIDHYLHQYILHSGVGSTRMNEYIPHNPSSIKMCFDKRRSSLVPWDIKHQWP